MADEAISTPSPLPVVSDLNGSPTDPDLSLIGRCSAERIAVEAAIAALKAAQQRVRETVSAFGDCRAAARAESGDYAAANNTSFEDAIEAAMLKIAVNASIIEDIVKTACSDCSEDSNE
jgi:ribonuclease HI